MTKQNTLGNVKSVRIFDSNKKGEIILRTSTGEITLKLSDDHESAFSGMAAVASAAVEFGNVATPNVQVKYDDNDMEIDEIIFLQPQNACPVATGACVPVSLGSKPKQSRRHKLDKLLANTRVPSTLGASFFHMARRYIVGKTASNELEERVFERLRRLSPDLQRIVTCTVDSFDSISSDDRNRLFNTSLMPNLDQPIDIVQLEQAFAQEVVENAAIQIFDDPRCATEELPGLIRTQPHPGGEHPDPPVIISRINDLRTMQFRPTPDDYTPDEIQQVCHVIFDGNQPKQVCEVQTTDCLNGTAGTACLRIPEFEAGQTVMLEGMNFSSVDIKIKLFHGTGTPLEVEVDAHVCGDRETPLTEIINGVEVPIIDSRVHDRLIFRLPDDLIPGLCQFQVIVPNVNNEPGWGDNLFSNGLRLTLTPPATARFQIRSENLRCKDETGSTSFGSDEVGITILSAPLLLPDLNPGPVQQPNNEEPIRFGDMDSGEQEGMDHLLFSHDQPIGGLIMKIIGFEIDGEDAFMEQIQDWTQVFVDILKDELRLVWDNIKDVIAIGGAIVVAIGWPWGPILVAAAIAVVLAIDLFVAFWAPADLIIEDVVGLGSSGSLSIDQCQHSIVLA